MDTTPTAAPFTGLGVALATPFGAGTDAVGGVRKPAVDHGAFARLVEHVLADGLGADWLVVLGSTGEAATVDDGERDALVRQAVIGIADLPFDDIAAASMPASDGWGEAGLPADWLGGELPATVERLERLLIADALARTQGNRAEAARRLGIHRQLLYRKIAQYGLE